MVLKIELFIAVARGHDLRRQNQLSKKLGILNGLALIQRVDVVQHLPNGQLGQLEAERKRASAPNAWISLRRPSSSSSPCVVNALTEKLLDASLNRSKIPGLVSAGS